MKSAIENLKGKDMLISEARKINGGKVQLTFIQKVDNPNTRPASIAGMLNKSDERFSTSTGVRYAWVSGTVQDIKADLDIDTSDLSNVGDTKELNILNPVMEGAKLNIQITEVDSPNDYERENYETAAKRAGKGGDFILTEDKDLIFSRATVVAGEPQHSFFKNTIRVKPEKLADFTSEEEVVDSEIESELNS